MNYGQMKNALKQLVDRPDITDKLAGEFIQRAIANLERSPLRLGFQKTVAHVDMDGRTNSIQIPGDYLELIDLFDDEKTYSMVVLGTWQKVPKLSPRTVYMTMGPNFLLKPTPPAGTRVYLHYYAESLKMTVDTDENPWTISATEAVLYTAARMADDFYQMGKGADWQNQADREILLLQQQDTAEEWSGDMVIENAYPNIC